MKRKLDQLSERVYDVVIIGGGIYGICVAWDAILRGLSVALVEKGDFGQATSSNSLRVIHGGLRYLQHGDIRRMRQSICERTVFMRIAPHLVHPLPILIPTYGHLLRGKEVLTLALLVNNLVSFDQHCLRDPQKHLPSGRVISKAECLRLFPGVEEKGLTGGAIVYDCQMSNSERLMLAFVRSATKAGADMTNYVEVTALLRQGDRVVGVRARDILNKDELDIRARIVVNASGPWSDRVLSLLHGHNPRHRLALSKAFNLLINRQLVSQYAVGVYSQNRFQDGDAILCKGARLFFMTPWHDRSLIGTAHLPFATDPDSARVTEEEIHAFLDEINWAYPAADLKRQDVCFVYGGLLPMANDSPVNGDVQLVKRYRVYDHQKEDGIEGLISVVGVKFTEARHVAEKTVDLVFRKLGKMPPKSATATTPLYGGQIDQFQAFVARESQRKPWGFNAKTLQRLISQYGAAYPEVLKYLDDNPASTLRGEESRGRGSPVLRAQVLHAVREEMAQKLTDVIFRRTDLSVAGYPGDACLQACAALMAKELNWNESRMRTEIEEGRSVFSTGM